MNSIVQPLFNDEKDDGYSRFIEPQDLIRILNGFAVNTLIKCNGDRGLVKRAFDTSDKKCASEVERKRGNNVRDCATQALAYISVALSDWLEGSVITTDEIVYAFIIIMGKQLGEKEKKWLIEKYIKMGTIERGTNMELKPVGPRAVELVSDMYRKNYDMAIDKKDAAKLFEQLINYIPAGADVKYIKQFAFTM